MAGRGGTPEDELTSSAQGSREKRQKDILGRTEVERRGVSGALECLFICP